MILLRFNMLNHESRELHITNILTWFYGCRLEQHLSNVGYWSDKCKIDFTLRERRLRLEFVKLHI